VIVAVPAATPVTSPVELMVAIVPSLLVHVPPGVASASVIAEPIQTVDGPVMAAGAAEFTVTTSIAAQPETV